jgi:hypothetical protein
MPDGDNLGGAASDAGSAPDDREPRDLVDQLRDLAVLRDKGVLSEGEFQRAKVAVLDEHQSGQTGRRNP